VSVLCFDEIAVRFISVIEDEDHFLVVIPSSCGRRSGLLIDSPMRFLNDVAAIHTIAFLVRIHPETVTVAVTLRWHS